ncbi:hypothetical protein DE146DRAFT_587963, partial [Phaeosphaeria sp. MPI-PUGE-AT-0046c]
NSNHSPLLRLPSEIRNRIYGYVFKAGYTCGVTDRGKLYSIQSNGGRHYLTNLRNPLSKASRQLHFETNLLPLQLNKFS